MTKANDDKQPESNANDADNGLVLEPNITDCDDFYDEILRAHASLDTQESEAFNARLILILCNHIGNRETISAALRAASVNSHAPSPSYGEGHEKNMK